MSGRVFARWQANFWAGLAIVLPGVISIAVLLWLFKTFSNITDALLIFLPKRWTHQDHGQGALYWYWSVVALCWAVLLVCMVGLLARNYFGKRLLDLVDATLLRVPLLNKIYGTTKQVNDAFTSGSKTAFRTVVMLEFPRDGVYSIGFITSEQQPEMQARTGEKVVCVFVPTTPNPTTGYLLLVPKDKLTQLEMSVSEAIKYIVSIGSLAPDYQAGAIGLGNSMAQNSATESVASGHG